MPNDAGSCQGRIAACLLGILSLGLACLALAPTASAAVAANPGLDPEERSLCKLVNQYRVQRGVAPLRVSPALTKAANWLSGDMAGHDVLAHVDSRGRNFGTRFVAFGYKGTPTGENIAAGMAGARATFTEWKNDPLHRAGMLSPKTKVIGIGRAYSADTRLVWYWTATFGATNDRAVAC